jgi:hypothetical protein
MNTPPPKKRKKKKKRNNGLDVQHLKDFISLCSEDVLSHREKHRPEKVDQSWLAAMKKVTN